VTYEPRPMNWHLLANAPGPDKRPFFATSTGAGKADTPREQKRAREHYHARKHTRRPPLDTDAFGDSA
jgi:hypothetical protein